MIQVSHHRLEADVAKPIGVALLGDLHLKASSQPMADQIVQILNSEPADLICFLGDFLQEPAGRPVLLSLRRLVHPNVFAVLGNHDYGVSFRGQKPDQGKAGLVTSALADIGIRVLRDEVVTLHLDGHAVSIAGIKDLWVERPMRLAAPVTILLSHNPDVIYEDIASLASLILSGHTHGGTIRFSRLLGRLSSRVGRTVTHGLYRYRGRQVFVTSGIGKTGGVLRIGVEPEVVFLWARPLVRDVLDPQPEIHDIAKPVGGHREQDQE